MCSPYPFIRFHLSLCFPRYLIMEKLRDWGKEKLITRYNRLWQSGNCDVCANILYWRILIWTSTFTTTATDYDTNCRAVIISLAWHFLKNASLSVFGCSDTSHIWKNTGNHLRLKWWWVGITPSPSYFIHKRPMILQYPLDMVKQEEYSINRR